MALLGPSGCGKSTLLDVLSGQRAFGTDGNITTSGSIELNGQTYAAPGAVALVPQGDNALYPILSVRETLSFYARLLMPRAKAVEESEVEKTVNNLLQKSRLSHVADSQVGGVLPGGFFLRGISGGERRRLMIACGLVGDPAVLLLDEPTSGLDAETAQGVMENLKEYADGGRIVLCAIHQPRSSIFHLFTEVLIVAAGRPFYFGPPQGVVAHFKKLSNMEVDEFTSPPDYALDALAVMVVSTENKSQQFDAIGKQITDSVRTLPMDVSSNRTHSKTTDSLPSAHFDFFRFRVLLDRTTKYFLRNIGNAIARMVVCLTLGLLIGLVFRDSQSTGDDGRDAQNALRVLFFSALMMCLLPYQTISLFQDTRQYYLLEEKSRMYGSLEYYAATFVAESVLVICSTIVFVLPAYWLTGLNPNAGVFFFALTVFALIYLASSAFMSLVANFAPNSDMSFAIGAFFSSIWFLFSGFFVLLPDLPTWMRWISHLTWLKYGFQSLVLNQFYGSDIEQSVLTTLDFDDQPRGRGAALGILVLWLVAFLVQAYMVLRIFPRMRQAAWYKKVFFQP